MQVRDKRLDNLCWNSVFSHLKLYTNLLAKERVVNSEHVCNWLIVQVDVVLRWTVETQDRASV